MVDGVSYIVVVFLGDYRARIWCHIPTGIKTLPSDDFPKPLCFEAECWWPMDNYGQRGMVICRCLMTFIEFLFILKNFFVKGSKYMVQKLKIQKYIFSPSHSVVFPRDNHFCMLPKIRLCQNNFWGLEVSYFEGNTSIAAVGPTSETRLSYKRNWLFVTWRSRNLGNLVKILENTCGSGHGEEEGAELTAPSSFLFPPLSIRANHLSPF